MGQFLDASRFAAGTASARSASNVFLNLTGAENPAGTNFNFTGLDTLAVGNFGAGSFPFNAVRAGPILVKYEYIGRLDVVAGTVSMGIAFSNVADVTGVSVGNPATTQTISTGLLPDNNYKQLQQIEDLPYSITVPSTESLRAIYVPHDYTMLNLKAPTDSSSTLMTQRLCILLTSNPASDPGAAGKITIVANWEAVPSPAFADILTTSYNEQSPSTYDPNGIFDAIVKNNLVITKEEEVKHLRF